MTRLPRSGPWTRNGWVLGFNSGVPRHPPPPPHRVQCFLEPGESSAKRSLRNSKNPISPIKPLSRRLSTLCLVLEKDHSFILSPGGLTGSPGLQPRVRLVTISVIRYHVLYIYIYTHVYIYIYIHTFFFCCNQHTYTCTSTYTFTEICI